MSQKLHQVSSNEMLKFSKAETNFHQPPSSSLKEENVSSSFIQIPGYPQGKRSSDTEGINCSEITGNGRFYM